MDTSREVSDTDRRSPLIGQQGGRRPNTRLSLADHFEYFNLKNDTVTFICDQSCLRSSSGIFQSASYKKNFSFREQTGKKLRTFSRFLEGETALISANLGKSVFQPITLLMYLCAVGGGMATKCNQKCISASRLKVQTWLSADSMPTNRFFSPVLFHALLNIV